MGSIEKSNFNTGERIDTYAQGTIPKRWYITVKSGLPEGFSGGAHTWAVLRTKQGMQYIWSTEELTLDNDEKNVPVICYDKNSKTYSVGYSDVTESNQRSYPVIAVNAKNDLVIPVGVTGSGYTGLAYEQAASKYSELLEAYKASK